jgi:hypothetical protein
MSTPDQLPPLPTKHFSGGQIALIIIGIILLLPGLCSLGFMIGMRPEFNSTSFNDPIAQMIFTLWGSCFAVSALGIVLIVVANKRARRPR